MKRATVLLIGLVVSISLLLGACGGTVGPTSGPSVLPPAGSPSGASGASGAAGTPGADLAAQGQQLAQQEGCMGCHSTNGQAGTGPTWKGLFGSQVTLSDGTTVTADANYLQQSIVDPNAQIVQGYQPDIMPQNYGQRLDSQQIQALVAYIESLK